MRRRLCYAASSFCRVETLYTPAAFSATTPTTDQILERFAEGPIWIAEVGTRSSVRRYGAPGH